MKQKKILSFLVNNENKLLLLKGSDKDPQFHKSLWYTVTGAVEDTDVDLTAAIKREIKEETNLDTKKVIDLNWKFEYESLGNKCLEYAFISYVSGNNLKLNEESIDYKWCDFEEFINCIDWFYDKKELYDKLKVYFS